LNWATTFFFLGFVPITKKKEEINFQSIPIAFGMFVGQMRGFFFWSPFSA